MMTIARSCAGATFSTAGVSRAEREARRRWQGTVLQALGRTSPLGVEGDGELFRAVRTRVAFAWSAFPKNATRWVLESG